MSAKLENSPEATGLEDQFSFQSQRKAKWLSEEALQIAEKRREAKEKGKVIPN